MEMRIGQGMTEDNEWGDRVWCWNDSSESNCRPSAEEHRVSSVSTVIPIDWAVAQSAYPASAEAKGLRLAIRRAFALFIVYNRSEERLALG